MEDEIKRMEERVRGSKEYVLEKEWLGTESICERVQQTATGRVDRGDKAGNSFRTHRIRFVGEINSLLQIIASF